MHEKKLEHPVHRFVLQFIWNIKMIYAGLDEKVIEVFREIRQESGKDSYFYTGYCLKFMDIDTIDTWTSTLV